MRIGELALRSGVAEKTLRYYEDVGLLDKPVRSSNGYRDYPDEVVERLRFVRSAQALGLTLAEIREVIALRDRGQTPCAHVLEVIERHSSEIEARIRELQQLGEELRGLVGRGRALDPRDCLPEGVCHIVPPRQPVSANPVRKRTR